MINSSPSPDPRRRRGGLFLEGPCRPSPRVRNPGCPRCLPLPSQRRDGQRDAQENETSSWIFSPKRLDWRIEVADAARESRNRVVEKTPRRKRSRDRSAGGDRASPPRLGAMNASVMRTRTGVAGARATARCALPARGSLAAARAQRGEFSFREAPVYASRREGKGRRGVRAEGRTRGTDLRATARGVGGWRSSALCQRSRTAGSERGLRARSSGLLRNTPHGNPDQDPLSYVVIVSFSSVLFHLPLLRIPCLEEGHSHEVSPSRTNTVFPAWFARAPAWQTLLSYPLYSLVLTSVLASARSSKISQAEKLQAAFLISAAGALSSPLIPAAEAATVSPSLRNLLRSVVAGTVVLVGLGVALSTISTFDRTER